MYTRIPLISLKFLKRSHNKVVSYSQRKDYVYKGTEDLNWVMQILYCYLCLMVFLRRRSRELDLVLNTRMFFFDYWFILGNLRVFKQKNQSITWIWFVNRVLVSIVGSGERERSVERSSCTFIWEPIHSC